MRTRMNLGGHVRTSAVGNKKSIREPCGDSRRIIPRGSQCCADALRAAMPVRVAEKTQRIENIQSTDAPCGGDSSGDSAKSSLLSHQRCPTGLLAKQATVRPPGVCRHGRQSCTESAYNQRLPARMDFLLPTPAQAAFGRRLRGTKRISTLCSSAAAIRLSMARECPS